MIPKPTGLMRDEKILGTIHAPIGFYWARILKTWLVISFFGYLCLVISFIFHDKIALSFAAAIILQMYALIQLSLWHLKNRQKNYLQITNYRVIKQTDEDKISINLEEIKDINIVKNTHFWGSKIQINAANRLEFAPLKHADDVAGYILKMQRRKKENKTEFPLYKNK